MKILIVSEKLPSRIGGGTARQFNLIRELANQHDVSIAAFAYPIDLSLVADLKPYVKDIEVVELPLPAFEQRSRAYYLFHSWMHTLFERQPRRGMFPRAADMRQKIRDLLNAHSFDIVQVHQAYMARYVPPLRTATLLDMHDILSDHERQLYQLRTKPTHRVQLWLEWQKMLCLERAVVRRFDVCTLVSDIDQARFNKLYPENRNWVVPNGVDTHFFYPQPDLEQPFSLIFMGSMNYPPNADAVRWFYSEIFPLIRSRLPNTQLQVVGWDPPEDILALNSDSQVNVTGFVDDVRSYLARSTVVVVPIRNGSGTRLKILDSWAMAKAIVSTSLGAEGLKAVHQHNLLLADSAEAFAEAVIGLMFHSDQRQRLGLAGRQLVEQEYSWKQITRQLEYAYSVACKTSRHRYEPHRSLS